MDLELVERSVDGILCEALLAPRCWTLRVHHDVVGFASLNVAHFERLDISGDFLFLTEYFVPRTNASDLCTLQYLLQRKLTACIPHNVGHRQSPLCVVWEVQKPDETSRRSLLAALLDQFVLLVSVVFYVEDKQAIDAEEVIRTISCDLKERYVRILSRVVGDGLEWSAGVGAVYTPRGNCIVSLARRLANDVCLNPVLCKNRRWLQEDVVVEELGLVSENLYLFLGSPSFDVAVALLPISSRICLMNCSMVELAWRKHVKSRGWNTEVLRQEIPHFLDAGLSSSFIVTPRSTFYLLFKGNASCTERMLVAWVIQPRVGSDSCVVLLTPASGSPYNLTGSCVNTDTLQAQCELLLSTFCFSVATAFFWTPLGVGKESGFLFRQGSLVVHLPSASTAYKNMTAAPLVAFTGVSLGSVILSVKDGEYAFRQSVTFTLLREFRCAEDYIDYIITEYLYDVQLGGKSAVFRRQGARRQSISSAAVRGLEKGDEHSAWIRLSDDWALYCAARECGVGRLLLTQACVMGDTFDAAMVEHWEAWVSGINVAALA